MPTTRPPTRYKILQPLQAVKLAEHPGSSLRDPTTTLVEIPADVVIEIESGPSESGLVNIVWNGEAFSVFHEDLREKAAPVGVAEA